MDCSRLLEKLAAIEAKYKHAELEVDIGYEIVCLRRVDTKFDEMVFAELKSSKVFLAQGYLHLCKTVYMLC